MLRYLAVDMKLFKNSIREAKISLQATTGTFARPVEFTQGLRLPIKGTKGWARSRLRSRVKPFWRTRSRAVRRRRRSSNPGATMELHYCVRCSFRRWGSSHAPRPNSSLKIDGALRYSRAVCPSPRNHMTLFPVTREDEIADAGSMVWGGFTNSMFSQFANTVSRSNTNSDGMTEKKKEWGERTGGKTVTGRISIPLEQRCLSRESFFDFQSVYFRRESAFLSSLFLYPSTSRRYIAELWYIIFPVGIRSTLDFPNCFRYCNRGCLSVTALPPIRLLQKNEIAEPKWISQPSFYPLEIENWNYRMI